MDTIGNDLRERADQMGFMARAFRAVAFNQISGDYVEFGSASAQTFRMAYTASRNAGLRCRLWSYDSFRGLPESEILRDAHPMWRPNTMKYTEAHFRANLAQHEIPDDMVSVVPGYYVDTLRDPQSDKHPRDICLAYIDCDLYSSTCYALTMLELRLKHGMIIAFDDYFCFAPNQASGERLALLHFQRRVERFGFLPYIQYGWHGMSFVVENRSFLE